MLKLGKSIDQFIKNGLIKNKIISSIFDKDIVTQDKRYSMDPFSKNWEWEECCNHYVE